MNHIAEVVGNSDPRRLVRTPCVRAREGQVAIGVLMERKTRKAINILGDPGIFHIPPRNGANHNIEAFMIESVAEHFVLLIHSPYHSLSLCKLGGRLTSAIDQYFDTSLGSYIDEMLLEGGVIYSIYGETLDAPN